MLLPLLQHQQTAGAAVVTNPRTSAGTGRVYPFPKDKKKRRKVLHLPRPEYEVSGPLSRDAKLENYRVPDFDQEAWEARLKLLNYLEAEEKEKKRVRRKKRVETVMIAWLLD